jgi:hypothetical protein
MLLVMAVKNVGEQRETNTALDIQQSATLPSAVLAFSTWAC